jgi:hypothetical protein
MYRGNGQAGRARAAVAVAVALGGLASCSLLLDTHGVTGGGTSSDASSSDESPPVDSGTHDAVSEAPMDSALADGPGTMDTGGDTSNDSAVRDAEPDQADVVAEAGGDSGGAIDLKPTQDSYVRDGTDANTNYGTDLFLWVKDSVAGYTRHAWISFNISSFSHVTSAKLRIYLDMLDMGAIAPVNVSVCYAPTASDSWKEATITWNNAPATGPIVTNMSLDTPNLGTWVEFDVTTSVQADTDGVATVVLQGDPAVSRAAIFDSSKSGHSPVLRITGS